MILKNLYKKNIIFLAVIAFGFLLFPDFVLAEKYKSLVPIPLPGMPASPDVLEYLSGLYKFFISVVGVVAMGAIVIGGARYLTSAGNSSAIEDAKHTINQALIGLFLAITSWVIINTINPDILLLKKPGVTMNELKNSSVVDDTPVCTATGNLGDGINTPCACMDDSKKEIWSVDKGKTATKITLTIAPNPVNDWQNVTYSGKLTDKDNAPLENKNINVIIYSKKYKNSFLTSGTTNASGNFSITRANGCASDPDPDQVQAIFPPGDSDYASSGSDIVDLKVKYTSGPFCTNYTSGVVLYDKSSSCNAICSNPALASDNKFHCFSEAKLGVGRNEEEAANGNYLLIDPPLKVGETYFYDAISNIESDYPIGKIEVDLDSGWWSSVFGPDYYCTFAPCGGGGCVLSNASLRNLDSPQSGKFKVVNPGVSTMSSVLKVTYKNPNTGNCDIEVYDKRVIVEVK